MKKYLLSPNVIYWAVGLFICCIAVAGWYYPYAYSFASNNISRLGRPSWNPDGYRYSFVGTFGSAAIMIGFYLSLWRWKLGHPGLDSLLKIIIALGLLTCALLMGLAVYNGDFMKTHRIVGASYFSVDFLMMLCMAYFAFRHPKIGSGVVILCLLSALFDLLYIQSFAKWSWAEWITVGINYGIGIWMALIKGRSAAVAE